MTRKRVNGRIKSAKIGRNKAVIIMTLGALALFVYFGWQASQAAYAGGQNVTQNP